MNIHQLLTDLQAIMPGVTLEVQFDHDELTVYTNLYAGDCDENDVQFLSTEDESIKFDAFDLNDKVAALIPSSEFADDDYCRCYITTGLRLSSPDLEPLD